MEQKELKNRLKELRKQKGVSQTEMAKAINVSYSQYSRYEAKGSKPNSDTLKKIADYLNTTVDFLLYGNSEQKAKDTLSDSDLINQFKEIESLPSSDRTTITKVISAYIRDFKTRQAYAI